MDSKYARPRLTSISPFICSLWYACFCNSSFSFFSSHPLPCRRLVRRSTSAFFCSNSLINPSPSFSAFFARGSFSLISFSVIAIFTLACSASVPAAASCALASASWPMYPPAVSSSLLLDDRPVVSVCNSSSALASSAWLAS